MRAARWRKVSNVLFAHVTRVHTYANTQELARAHTRALSRFMQNDNGGGGAEGCVCLCCMLIRKTPDAATGAAPAVAPAAALRRSERAPARRQQQNRSKTTQHVHTCACVQQQMRCVRSYGAT